MRDRLLIVGAGGFGREVMSWALQVPAEQRDWELGGFLDANPKSLLGKGVPYSVLGDPLGFEFEPGDRAVIAVGAPATRRMIAEALDKQGVRFVTIIHPSVIIGSNCTMGVGCIFCPGVILTANVAVGDHVIFNCQSGAGHDTVIESYCTISGAVDVTGNCRIRSGAMLGSHATVTPQSDVGEGAVVGAGSVVIGKVPPDVTVFGVPARQIWASARARGDHNVNQPLPAKQ